MGSQGARQGVRGVGEGWGVRGEEAATAARGGRLAVCATVVLCATGLLGGTATAAQRSPDPPGEARHLEDVRKEIDALYRKAEQATDAYNAAEEQVRLQEKEIVDLARTIDGAQRRLAALKRQAGALASAQYRGGGIPTEAKLILNADPEAFLNNADLARKGQQAAKGVINQLTHLKSDLEGYARSATDRWEQLEANRKKKDAARKEINDKIDAAKALESRLAAKEKDRLRKLEDDQALLAQQKWLDSGVLKDITHKASDRGKKAISYATSQIGKDYVWGAVGPDTFDCSGLTLRSWQAAGRTIPRTSQEQWRQLPRVSLQEMRPGDLIIYFSDASHVGMYLGDGAIVHAPRPGRQVTITGAGSMPILGVVRPDGDSGGGVNSGAE
ncbi:glycoside hydrolase [Streptomyces albospinus]|uniref:Glycoside hydrolase n=1 Tax=Streptomyces albospinus TaxID=285515 RepID=A0ABQ2V3T4_9ACTN|nr:glycoside hydrolase [Streptomyces albospinus]